MKKQPKQSAPRPSSFEHELQRLIGAPLTLNEILLVQAYRGLPEQNRAEVLQLMSDCLMERLGKLPRQSMDGGVTH